MILFKPMSQMVIEQLIFAISSSCQDLNQDCASMVRTPSKTLLQPSILIPAYLIQGGKGWLEPIPVLIECGFILCLYLTI